MSSAAVTLQCPTCGGVFLTLQQQSAGMEICPHCAAAAPRASYRRMDGEAAFPRQRTVLPARRSVAPPSLDAAVVEGTDPLPSPLPGSTAPDPFQSPAPFTPAPQPWQSPFAPAPTIAPTPTAFAPSAAPPVEPPPPLSPPILSNPEPSFVLASSPPATAFFRAPEPTVPPALPPPPAPVAPPSPAAPTAPLPPPQIGFSASQEAPPPVSPFLTGGAPSTVLLSSPDIAPFQKVVPPPVPDPLPANATPPVWPGLGVTQTPNPTPAPEAPPLQTPKPAESPEAAASTPGWLESQQPAQEEKAPEPAAPPRRGFLKFTIFVFLSAIAGLGLAMWKFSKPHPFPAATDAPATPTVSRPSPSPASSAPTPPAAPTLPSVAKAPPVTPAPTPAPAPVTDPLSPPATGMIPSGEAAARLDAAQQVLQSFNTAVTIDEKLKWIAGGETHRDSLARFLATNPKGIDASLKDPDVGLFTELPSGKEVKLFVAHPPSCPSGVMVRVKPAPGGKELLDWELLEQTHQLEFDKFASVAGDLPPRWFTLLGTRARGSDLSGSAQEAHLAFLVQGSLSAQGEAGLYVKKQSEAGKLLESRVAWGRVYLIRGLIQRTIIDGKKVLLMLDCEGTATASKAGG